VIDTISQQSKVMVELLKDMLLTADNKTETGGKS